jgi:hypothetical protein
MSNPFKRRHMTFDDAFKNENRFVRQMIYSETCKEPPSRFGVYIDHHIDVDWKAEGHVARKVSVAPQNQLLSHVLCEIGWLEAAIHNWPTDLKMRSKRLLCEALACMLRGDAQGSAEAMEYAREFVNERSPQVSRYWILRNCLYVSSAVALASLVILYFRASVTSVIGPTSFALIMSFCAGCVGALLFVVLQLGKQPLVKARAERRLHFVEAVARIVVGGVAGVLLAGVVKLGLFNPFGTTGNGLVGMCLIAMIAGASERLAAGIVTRVENAESTQLRLKAKRATATQADDPIMYTTAPGQAARFKQSRGVRRWDRVVPRRHGKANGSDKDQIRGRK